MFEDFDSMDMYGFLDYLEESSNLSSEGEVETVILEEQYGIFKDENGNLCVEEQLVNELSEIYNLSKNEVVTAIMESYEEDLLAEAGTNMEEKEKISRYYAGMNPDNGTDHSVRNKRIAKGAAVVGGAGAVAAGGVLAVKAVKKHKAKKEAKSKKGLRGKLRRLREGEEFMLEEKYGIFEDENGELFIENEMVEYIMDEFDLYEEDAIDVIMESYEEELDLLDEELYSEGKYVGDPRNLRHSAPEFAGDVRNYVSSRRGGDDQYKQVAKDNLKASGKQFAKDAAIPAGAAGAALAAGGTILAAKAIKKHRDNKKGKKGRKCGKKHLREDALSVAHAVSSDSHYHVSDDAHRLYRQAEMDEGDADRNLARGGKHVLGGIKQAPRSEQDKAGKEGVRFKNRVDDGDMDGEFIDSGIQKPMGSGRRIAEDSDMGF